MGCSQANIQYIIIIVNVCGRKQRGRHRMKIARGNIIATLINAKAEDIIRRFGPARAFVN